MPEESVRIDWPSYIENVVSFVEGGDGKLYELSLILPERQDGKLYAYRYIQLYRVEGEERIIEIQVPVYTYDCKNPQGVVNLVNFIREKIETGVSPDLIWRFLFDFRQLPDCESMTYGAMREVFEKLVS